MAIREHFMIIPDNELFVLRKSLLSFKLALIKREESRSSLKGLFFIENSKLNFQKFLEIDLPNSNYDWNIDNQDLCEIQQNGMLKMKNKLGVVHVLVKEQSNFKKFNDYEYFNFFEC